MTCCSTINWQNGLFVHAIKMGKFSCDGKSKGDISNKYTSVFCTLGSSVCGFQFFILRVEADFLFVIKLITSYVVNLIKYINY